MDLATLLYSLLMTGAGLVASGTVSEFAKGAGKTAFDALKAHLLARGAASVTLIDQAEGNAAYEAVVKSDLARPNIVDDAEVRRLAEQLRAAIDALPADAKARYAVDIGVIETSGALLFENVEGVTSDRATSEGDMTFKNVKAPPGK